MSFCTLCPHELIILDILNESEIFHNLKKKIRGLPWWLSGKESACQCRRHGFNPWSWKIPHAMEQQSLCATTIEPVLWSPRAATFEPLCCNYWSPQAREPMLCNKRSHCNENSLPCNSTVAPLAATREKPMQQGGPSTAKNIKINKEKI